jgi:hypothetical protein
MRTSRCWSTFEYIGRKGEVLKEQEEGVRAEVEGLRIRNEALKEKIRR